ncbi:hypothetical protein H477_4729 [[Clostridium] sordellii ATCC 9714]|nr:hypothetical protein H477_4729 [[Clostridium] sordellii ATCC 9714] [Paeniclostridium sordellii ATCC 9714]
MEIDKKIRRAIVECKNIEEIYSMAKEDNMITFEDSFKYLLKENITTINECLLTNLFSEVR